MSTQAMVLIEANSIPEPNSGCWLWLGTMRDGKYGALGPERAHRASFKAFRGSIPNGMCVCHACDNPSCVNPDHLFLGSHLQNMQDKSKKGRAAALKGSQNPRCRLSEVDIRKIRFMRKHGYPVKIIAERFDLSHSHVNRICRGASWSHTETA